MSERKLPIIKNAVAGMPVSASEYNKIIKAVTGSTPYDDRRHDRMPIKDRPFEPIIAFIDGVYKIAFGIAYFIDCNVQAPMTVEQIDGINYDGNFKRDWHVIEDGQVVYVDAKFDKYGALSAAPTIVIGAEEDEGKHYIPLSGYQTGESGNKLWRIGKFTGGSFVSDHVGNHIVYFPHRPAFKNLLDDENPKEHGIMQEWVRDLDVYEMRALKQLDAAGVGLIKDAEIDAETGMPPDTIDFRTISSYDEDIVSVTEEPDTARLSWVPTASGRLIHVDCDDEETVLLTWDRGLPTTVGDVRFIAGCSGTSTPPTMTPP